MEEKCFSLHPKSIATSYMLVMEGTLLVPGTAEVAKSTFRSATIASLFIEREVLEAKIPPRIRELRNAVSKGLAAYKERGITWTIAG